MTGGNGKQSPSLSIATLGIALAITIMLLSIAIVDGFKSEISGKIYSLDSHIKITNAALGLDNNIYTVHSRDVFPVLNKSGIHDSLCCMSLIAEQPLILKTAEDFKGIVYKGVDGNYDWSYLQSSLVDGQLPKTNDSDCAAISQRVASQLGLSVGDKIYAYFCNHKIKVRRVKIVGIFKTDLEEYDTNYMIGPISFLQKLNNWAEDEGNYIGIMAKDTQEIPTLSYSIFNTLSKASYDDDNPTTYNVRNTNSYNANFFSWLNLLDMNVVIIIILMTIVSGFTLIAALLMIVLERIKMIGLLKTLGATNASIKLIFISLTQKIVYKAIVLGNCIGLTLACIQAKCHIVKLDAEAYYMPYVPIEINWQNILLLNVAIIIIAYLTLVGPSHIISNVRPSRTLRYE